MPKRHAPSKRARHRQEGDERRALCFVIMPFGDPFDRYFSNIYEPAITNSGLEPVRADSLFRPSPILEDIWRFTRSAKVLLADLSGKNPNVFYEVGLAHAVAKPVILVASSIDDVPFDLRGLRVLIYNKDNESWGAELRSSLEAAVQETITDVSGAVPPTFLRTAPAPPGAPKTDTLDLRLRRIENSLRAVVLSAPQAPEREVVYVDRPVPVLLPPDIAKSIRSSNTQLYSALPNDSDLAQVIAMVMVDRRINAIKLTREKSSLGLKEAKDVVDAAHAALRTLGHISLESGGA